MDVLAVASEIGRAAVELTAEARFENLRVTQPDSPGALMPVPLAPTISFAPTLGQRGD